MSNKNPQDGFDLIDYPCDFPFKAMCKVDKKDDQVAVEVISKLILQYVDQSALIETHTNKSRTGKFESVTVTVRLSNRQQLEAIYKSISAAPRVVMTL
jgi:putative lipoic acid-binding regulatory protein